MSIEERGSEGLRVGFTPLEIWAFSIGTSIGWGSFIVTCNTYLQKAGILGTTFGLLLGMAVILVIAWNLQYMIQSAPDAGGIYTFEKRVGGKDLGFLAAWFVLLTYIAILWANITSLPLFARFFLGDVFHFGFHYHIFGYEVWMGEAMLSMAAILLIGVLCSRSSRLPSRVMAVSALVFAVGFTVCAVIAVLRHDGAFSYSPLYAEGSDAFRQIVRIAAISPWAFIGFENISHFSEEYAFPAKRIRGILIWSVLITTALYVLVSLLSISAYPGEYESWMAYIQDMGNLSGIRAVPAFYAADHYLGQPGVTILMLALFGVILTSLIGNLLALSRLLYAAGREGEAPASLGKLNGRSIPQNAIGFVVAVSLLIPFLGRTAIGWIVDVTTLGATIIYGMISQAVYMHAKAAGRPREQATGIAGLALMGVFLLLLLIPGLLPFHAMETESYVLFIVWAVLGLGYFRLLIQRDRGRSYGQRIAVWVILLMMVLFASMMWVSRATENAADEAVQRIFDYHQNHPESDTDPMEAEARTAFLQEEADRISRTNTLYMIVSLGLFIISTLILMNNYRDTVALDKQLTAAEEAAEAARKIAELRASLTTLMDNMPGMSFSKDARTGVYLACNQAFAEYAHKASPEGVVGLTDAQIFDPVTAAKFVEDDRMALSMDEPFIFFEDVPDAVGNQRQFQTTKLKFVDDVGRLCTLGLCQDVTDMVRIQRENVTTKEAYEKARSMGVIYTHIAQTLARSYTDLYYVNIDTGEFIEYVTNDDSGTLKEARRGVEFFDECKIEAEAYVYPDDRAAFVKALDKGTLLEALNRNGTFIMAYRLLTESGATYVTMKVSRMEDDERFIIIGVTDTDEQMKQQRAIERAKEEHIAYARLSALAGDFLSVYTVVRETGRYREYSIIESFRPFALPREGADFFADAREQGRRIVFSADCERFLSMFTRDGVLSEIDRNGSFSLTYRLVLSGTPIYVQLKAAMVEEEDGIRLVVGVSDIDKQVRQEEDYARRLAQAQSKANIDALTGVKNKHAYLDAEEKLNQQIEEGEQPEFAISILDVNDLKKVNDTEGHKIGDQYLRDACMIVCHIFKHSPVFRIGGDEFAVISQGSDYAHIDELVETMDAHNTEAAHTGGIVIACGMARREGDACVTTVFERADQRMYENKNCLKASR